MRLGTAQARPQWLQVGLGLAVIVATYLFLIFAGSQGLSDAGATGSSRLIALVGYLVGAALVIWGVANQFTTSTYALIPIAIAINIVVGQVVGSLGLPIYLDSIGTVLVGVLVGPLAGAATGGLTNIIWGLTLSPIAMPFAVVAIVIGLLAGVFARLGWFRRFYLAPIAGAITGVVAALLSAPLSAFVFGGATGAGTDLLVAAFRAAGESVLGSSLRQGLISDPPDKLISFLIVYFVVVALPARQRTRFSQSSALADKLPQ